MKQIEDLNPAFATKYKRDSHNYGTVHVTDLVFPMKRCKRKRKSTMWYTATISCGNEIFATEAVQANSDGYIVFNDKFEITPESNYFEITIELYGLQQTTTKVRLFFLFLLYNNICIFTEVQISVLSTNKITSLFAIFCTNKYCLEYIVYPSRGCDYPYTRYGKKLFSDVALIFTI